jgi:drug/metabolite transporter (DMT)-like permease
MSRQFRSEIYLALMCVLWGFTFPVIRGSLESTDPHLYLSLRFLIAAPLTGIIFRRRIDLSDFKTLLTGIFLGTVLFAGYITQTIGLAYTTATRSGFLTALYIVMVPLLMGAYRRRLPTSRMLLAAFLAFGGVAVMSGSGLFTGAGLQFGLGDWLTVACAFFFAIQILLTGALPRPGRVWTLHLSQLSTVAVLSTISFFLFGEARVTWDADLGLSLLVTGLLGTVLALGIQLRYQRDTTPERAALVYSLEPLFAAAAAWLMLSERMSMYGFAGGLLILTSLVLSAKDEAKTSGNAPVAL